MLYLNKNTAIGYKSNSQIARVITETWVGENIFCPNCGNKILHYENNKPVADFYCQICNEDYELKSGKSFGKKIIDGAYFTMKESLSIKQQKESVGLVVIFCFQKFQKAEKYFI